MWNRVSGVGLLVLLLVLVNVAAEAEATPSHPKWRVELVAHRGLSPGFPENTVVAFRNMLMLEVDVIELDLRGTSDGAVVVLHDETVDRTTNGTGAITKLTLAEAKLLDAGSYVASSFAEERIPTLDEVLELARGSRTKLLLDVKLSEVLDKERIVRLIERFDAVLDVIVGVRSVSELKAFRALNPNLRTVGFVPDTASIESFVHAGVDIVRLWPDWMFQSSADPECRHQYLRRLLSRRDRTVDFGSASCLVHRVHSLGKPVWVTAKGAPRDVLEELIGLRANGILTDVPEVLTNLLMEREAWQ